MGLECKNVSSCETVNYNYTALSQQDREHFLFAFACYYYPDTNHIDPSVCCSKYNAGNDLDIGDYAKPHIFSKLIGGVDADIQEFPWLALLVYNNNCKRNCNFFF